LDSVKAWSKDLEGSKAKLHIAAIAQANDGSGFVDANTLTSELAKVKALGLGNFGGAAIWDGSQAIGAGHLEKVVKQALTS
jgi:hypothetical protein